MEGQVRRRRSVGRQRLKALEDENAKLKKLLAEAELDKAMLKEIASKKMVTPAARRELVAHLRLIFVGRQYARADVILSESRLQRCQQQPLSRSFKERRAAFVGNVCQLPTTLQRKEKKTVITMTPNIAVALLSL